MSPHLKKSITLLELLIAITLLSVIVLGFTSIDLFSRYHVLTADRRAKVQNEASYVLEHMAKEMVRAIGDFNNPAVSITTTPSGNPLIRVWVDANRNGIRDSVAGGDREIAYRY